MSSNIECRCLLQQRIGSEVGLPPRERAICRAISLSFNFAHEQDSQFHGFGRKVQGRMQPQSRQARERWRRRTSSWAFLGVVELQSNEKVMSLGGTALKQISQERRLEKLLLAQLQLRLARSSQSAMAIAEKWNSIMGVVMRLCVVPRHIAYRRQLTSALGTCYCTGRLISLRLLRVPNKCTTSLPSHEYWLVAMPSPNLAPSPARLCDAGTIIAHAHDRDQPPM